MKRAELIEKVLTEIFHIQKERGIDILNMPEQEMSKWVEHLVRQENKK
jgi:hypothetical protein